MEIKRRLYAKNSNTANTVLRGVIRDDIGHYKLRQCHTVTHYQKPVSQHIIANDRKTVGDILNRLKFNQSIRDTILVK
jgi:hypothetical protein